MRKLALDVGIKSCGIALSDSKNLIAIGKENFFFQNSDWNALIIKIKLYLKEFNIDVIVIGYPTLPSGDKTKTTIMIENFKNLLIKNVKQKVVFVDENNTTKQAKKIMIDANLQKSKRKKYKDQISAQLILENYLRKRKKI